MNGMALLALLMIATFMVLIMSGRVSAMIALILVPAAFGLASGHGAELGEMMLKGVKDLAPTGVMLIFAILYFGLMIDVGLFEPLTARIVRITHGNPERIMVGTAVLAMLVSLDGDGSTTYMITTATMIPLYRHLRMDLRKMAAVIVMSSAVMNILPWGGPTARVMSALKLDAGSVFLPLLPAMALTAAWVLLAAWLMGRSERARLSTLEDDADEIEAPSRVEPFEAEPATPRPKAGLRWANLVLTAALLVALVADVLPLPILFMLAFAVALTINFPKLADQREAVLVHAGNALSVAGMIFAAGILTGILAGTGMTEALTHSVTGLIPVSAGRHLALITALLSAPFTYFISNDAFYFGVLPILASTGASFGLGPAEMGRAALVGQQIHLLSPLVPSTFLLVGLAGIEFGDLLRTVFKWAAGSFLVFLLACIVFGIFPVG